jgi:triphosphoribosyl-dephospho-CoA synthase
MFLQGVCVITQLERVDIEVFSIKLSRLATTCLYEELALAPKPGLVSFVDAGSHQDMDSQTFINSIISLGEYFKLITKAGANSCSFSELKQLGCMAETQMLQATQGINTHRGAIFCLGLLCAAAGMSYQKHKVINRFILRQELLVNWGDSLQKHAYSDSGIALGARQEAALGMPSVFNIGLPQLDECLIVRGSIQEALIETLMHLLSHLYDTNIVRRSGHEGLHFVQQQARYFIDAGGVSQPGWTQKLWGLHNEFKKKHISPGGAADILAASLFVYLLEQLTW